MSEEKPDLSENVVANVGGVQGEPAGDLPDEADVTSSDPDKGAKVSPGDSGPIEPAGSIVEKAPHPEELKRAE